MRRLLILFMTAVLVAAACSDDGEGVSEIDGTTSTTSGPSDDGDDDDTADDDTGDDGETDEDPTEPIPTGPSPGVTDDTIKIGITYVDLEPVRDFVDLDHGDYEATYIAVIEDINANGGIHGRMIEPVLAGVSPLGAAQADETCVRMAQDEGVFAVIGFHFADTPLCYLEIEQVAVIGGEMNEERLSRATAPWFSFEQSSDLDLDALATFSEEGLLDGPFAVYGTINEPGLYDSALARLDELGHTPVADALLDADPSDVNDQIAKVRLIVENFSTAGAETVIVAGSGPVSWANGVEETDYRPRMLMTNAGNAEAIISDAGGRDLSILDDAILAGLYSQDLQFQEPVMQECIAVVEAAGIEVPDPATLPDTTETNPFVATRAACQAMALFVAIADAAGPDLNYGSFRYAGEHLGELSMPGYPEPWTYGAPPSADGDPTVYLYEFDPASTSFVQIS